MSQAAGSGAGEPGSQFSREAATELIRNVIETTLNEESYRASEVKVWMNSISQNCLEALRSHSNQHKFLLNITICQWKNYGLHSTTSAYWNSETDQSIMVKWNNKTIMVVVTLFALLMT
jgi:dynein light chain Tctex-type 1